MLGLTLLAVTTSGGCGRRMSSMASALEATAWRRRIEGSIAKSRKIRGGNYVQLATADAEGHPRVRTVVFRGFVNECDMSMITDARSGKPRESAACELCWWFSQSSEQYRIAGRLRYIDSNDADPDRRQLRKQRWGNLSDKAREQFFWAHPPRAPFDPDPEVVPAGGRDQTGSLLDPPDVFLLVLLEPQSCDYLRLTDNYRQIDTLQQDGNWLCTRVNP